jgi:hypothetical protein
MIWGTHSTFPESIRELWQKPLLLPPPLLLMHEDNAFGNDPGECC